LYFYISTFRSMCAVPNMAVFCSSLTSWFPSMLLLLLLLLLFVLSSLVTGLFVLVHLLKNGDPHRSGFKLHTAVLSVLCVMFQVQLPFVANLSNIFLVQFPNISLSFSLLF